MARIFYVVFILGAFFALATHSSAQSPPVCDAARKKEILTELEGIDAVRKMGGLSLARGVCTVVRSAEGWVGWAGGNGLKKVDSVLKKMDIDIPANIVSDTCKQLHKFADDLAVGRREEELRKELETCPK